MGDATMGRTGSIAFGLLLFLLGQAGAVTRYVKVGGLSSGSCTNTTECTLDYAATTAQAGDTITVRSGTYVRNAPLTINCSAGHQNGSAGNPITVQAETERQVLIDGDGSGPTINIISCAYWSFIGLRIKSSDNPSNGSLVGAVILTDAATNHLTFRRNIIYQNNRYFNGALLDGYATDSLIEQNEFYDNHRNGAGLGDRNTWRENYLNSRGRADIGGGYPSIITPGGDVGFVCYPCSDNIYENNITEGGYAGFSIQAAGQSSNNKYLGNIAIGALYGFLIQARVEGGSGLNQMPVNTVMQNNLALNSINLGVFLRGNKNTQIDNTTAIGAANSTVFQVDTEQTVPGDGAPSFHGDNNLVMNGSQLGIYVAAPYLPYTWTMRNPNSYNNAGGNYTGSGNGSFVNSTQIDPSLGNCPAFIRSASPMKASGFNGGDVGANILYAYENGILQNGTGGTANKPLWNTTTKELNTQFVGTVVTGVNDTNGLSTLGSRLHPNCASWPAGYGSLPTVTITTPSSSPTFTISTATINLGGTVSP